MKRFAAKEMHTSDVRVDTQLNRYMWSRGCRNVPRLVRIRVSRKKNEDETKWIVKREKHTQSADFFL